MGHRAPTTRSNGPIARSWSSSTDSGSRGSTCCSPPTRQAQRRPEGTTGVPGWCTGWTTPPPATSLPRPTSGPCWPRRARCPRDDAAWAFEFKWDGIRAVDARRRGPHPHHLAQRQRPERVRFPSSGPWASSLGSHQVVLDGEIVAFDDEGRPRFQSLQPRIHAADAAKAKRLAAEHPVVYVIFDLLYLDGASLIDASLRRAAPSTRGSRARRRTTEDRGR